MLSNAELELIISCEKLSAWLNQCAFLGTLGMGKQPRIRVGKRKSVSNKMFHFYVNGTFFYESERERQELG